MYDRTPKAATSSMMKRPAVHFQKRFMPFCSGPRIYTRAGKECQHETAAASYRDRLRRGKLALSLERKNSSFVLVPILSAKHLSFFFVLRESLFNDLDRGVRRPDVVYLNLLTFKLFVVLEKALQNEQSVRRQFVGFDVAVEFGIVGGHGNDLIVAGSGIDHRHQADGPRFDERQRLNRLLAQNENIERIVVVGVSLRDEA